MWHDFLVFVYNFDVFGDRGLSRPPPTHCYVTVWRPSICPSVSHRSTAVTADGGFAAKRRRLQQISCSRRRRSAANAGSVMLTADANFLFIFDVKNSDSMVHYVATADTQETFDLYITQTNLM